MLLVVVCGLGSAVVDLGAEGEPGDEDLVTPEMVLDEPAAGRRVRQVGAATPARGVARQARGTNGRGRRATHTLVVVHHTATAQVLRAAPRACASDSRCGRATRVVVACVGRHALEVVCEVCVVCLCQLPSCFVPATDARCCRVCKRPAAGGVQR